MFKKYSSLIKSFEGKSGELFNDKDYGYVLFRARKEGGPDKIIDAGDDFVICLKLGARHIFPLTIFSLEDHL